MARQSTPFGGLFAVSLAQSGLTEKGTKMIADLLDRQPRLAPRQVMRQPLIVPPEDQLSACLRRGRRERFYVEMLVTPDIARELLSNNPDNRRVVATTVDKYALTMRRDEWVLNGQDIIVAKTGELNDGQNRLLAVVDTDVPVLMGLKFGFDRDTRDTLDDGRKRTLGDRLTMADIPNSSALAATLRLLWCYDNGIFSFSQTPSPKQAFDCLNANPTIQDFLYPGARLGSKFKAGGADLALAGYVCSRINTTIAEELMEAAGSDIGHTNTHHPAFKIRQRFLEHLASRKPLAAHESAAVFIMGFNDRLRRRNSKKLYWAPASGVKFPIAGT
jgi:hypothetical protein